MILGSKIRSLLITDSVNLCGPGLTEKYHQLLIPPQMSERSIPLGNGVKVMLLPGFVLVAAEEIDPKVA